MRASPTARSTCVQGIGEEAGCRPAGRPGRRRGSRSRARSRTGRSVAAAAARQPHPDVARAWGEVAVRGLRRRRPRRRGAARRSTSSTTRVRSAWRAPGSSWSARCWMPFLERFPEAAAAIVQGDPRDEATDIGPLDHARALRARRRLRPAREGVRAPASLFGGGPERGARRSLLPADVVRRRAPDGSEILTQEVFGPVLTVQTFDDEDEAVALANGTDYGLAAIVYTGDDARARRVSRADRGRDGLGQLLLRPRPRRAVRRIEGTRVSGAKAASGASTSTRT